MTTAKTPAKAAKPKAPPKPAAKPAETVKTGAQVAREAAKTIAAGMAEVNTTRAFTLHREDGTSRDFVPGLNRNVHSDDANHWFVKAHLHPDHHGAGSGVADVRKIANPNGAQAQAAPAAKHDADKESTTQALDMGKGEGGEGEGEGGDYSDDDAADDRARAEAGDADAQERLDAYEAALRGGDDDQTRD